MFDPKLLATEGLYPSLATPLSIATCGVLEIEVEIVVERRFGGGGYAVLPQTDKYKVRIIVRYRGKVWSHESPISPVVAKVAMRSLNLKINEPTVVVNDVGVQRQTHRVTSIKVSKK